MNISPEQFRKMELKTFMLVVKAYRSNSDNCMTKMETLKEVARALRIGPATAFKLIRDMKYQTGLNAREQVRQMRESQ